MKLGRIKEITILSEGKPGNILLLFHFCIDFPGPTLSQVTMMTTVLSAVQEFFFPRMLKWKVGPNKLAHPGHTFWSPCLSLVRDWLICVLFFVPIFDLLLVSLSPPRMCQNSCLSLQPGFHGCCLTLEIGEYLGSSPDPPSDETGN